MRDDPDGLVEFLASQAYHLDQISTNASEMPTGMREVMLEIQKHRSAGTSFACMSGRSSLVHSYNGAIETWMQWFLSTMDTVFTLVHLHPMAACILLICMCTARGDGDGMLQPTVYLEGKAAVGKTKISMIPEMFFAAFTAISHESRLAQTGAEHQRFLGNSYDETNLEEIGAEIAVNLQLVRQSIANRSMGGKPTSGLGLQMSTSSTVSTKALRYTEDGKRQSETFKATVLRFVLKMSNHALSVASEQYQRRGFFYAVATASNETMDLVTRQSSSTDVVSITAQARMESEACIRNLGNVTGIINTLNSAEILMVNTGAAVRSYNIASSPGWCPTPYRYRHQNPYQKFRQQLVYSTTVLGAIVSNQLWIGAVDPLRPVSPFSDAMAMRELLYSTEESTCLALDVVMGRAFSQVMPPSMPVVIERLRTLFLQNPDEPQGPGNLLITPPASNGNVPHVEEYTVKTGIFTGARNDLQRIVTLSHILKSSPVGSEYLQRTIEVCICHLLAGPPCQADEAASGRAARRSLIFFGNDMYVLRSLVNSPIREDLLAFKARAFPPGTRHLVFHRSMDVEPTAPSKMVHDAMTYQKYARILNSSALAEATERLMHLESRLVGACGQLWSRAVAPWTSAVRARAATAADFVSRCMMELRDNARPLDDLETVVRQWCSAQVVGVEARTVSAQVNILILKCKADRELAAAVNEYHGQCQAIALMDNMTPDGGLVEDEWRRHTMHNPSYADMDGVGQQVELLCMHPDAKTLYSDQTHVPFPSAVFHADAEQHLLGCGVSYERLPHQWSSLDNRRMLEDLANRRNRARGALVTAIIDYNHMDQSKRENVLRRVIELAWATGEFFMHEDALGGLTYRVTRDHIALFFRPRVWDVSSAMDLRRAEFAALSEADEGSEGEDDDDDDDDGDDDVVDQDRLLNRFVDITAAIVLHMLYSRFPRDAAAPVYADMPDVDADIVAAVRARIPVVREGARPTPRSAATLETRIRDMFVCATLRPDANRFQVPVYADGSIPPSSAVDHRVALHKITIRRLAFQDAARDFFVDGLLESLSHVWRMNLDTGARRAAVLEWMIAVNDRLMVRRAYGLRNVFELQRARKWTDATVLQQQLGPRCQLPPVAPYYPYDVEMQDVLIILGKDPVPPIADLPITTDWAAIDALGVPVVPPAKAEEEEEVVVDTEAAPEEGEDSADLVIDEADAVMVEAEDTGLEPEETGLEPEDMVPDTQDAPTMDLIERM